MDVADIPWSVLVAVLVAIPLGMALFFGSIVFRRMTPLAFKCSRCGTEFTQPPHRRFPQRCPGCHVRCWNQHA